MKILVTGGTGVIGTATVTALLERGHSIRLLSRHADQHARSLNGEIEAFPANLADLNTLDGCAAGCQAVLHIAGIVAEAPPERTFEKINVQGTRRIVEEADRGGVQRFVYVSSLGADRGTSGYHRSKLAAEDEVKFFARSWVIARPGSVYGPGDVVISTVLQMVRSLPAIPVLDDGDQQFQPVWHEDLAIALAELVDRGDLSGRTVELSGVERTSTNDLLHRLSEITGRNPARLPVPSPLASLATRIAGAMGVETPVNEAEIQMLLEGNVIEPQASNALPDLIGRPPTPLDEGLRTLARSLPEQSESEGIGGPLRKRFYATIQNSEMTSEQLCSRFKAEWTSIVPLEMDVEPGADKAQLTEGATLTMALPGRGNVQVRCREITDRSITLATLQGHPLAGVITFAFSEANDMVLFEIMIEARAANLLDLLALKSFGEGMQDRTWRSTVESVIDMSGGQAAAGVESETGRDNADHQRAP